MAANKGMADLRPCGADDQPHDAHAVGGRHEHAVSMINGSIDLGPEDGGGPDTILNDLNAVVPIPLPF
jgi:hypothetical protein